MTLKQRWFWADSKKEILFIYHDVWKIKNLYINIKKMIVFQRGSNVSLSTLNRRRNLTLKQRWFWVDSKKLLSLTIIQCLRTVTLNDICSDLICLRTVVFSWYFYESFQEMVKGGVHFQWAAGLWNHSWEFFLFNNFNSTLMQNWKSVNIFVFLWK